LKNILQIFAVISFFIITTNSFSESLPFDSDDLKNLTGWKIKDVTITPDIGIINPSFFLEITPQTTISPETIHEIIEKVWGTGKVVKVSIYAKPLTNKNVSLVIHVILKTKIHNLEFKGNKSVKSSELTEILSFQPDSELFNETIPEIEQKITEHYTMRGYPYAKVTTEKIPLKEPGKLKLRIRVEEGKPIRIWKISFSGKAILSPLQYKKLLGVKDGDIYDQIKIEKGINKIEKEIKSLGFYNCKVHPPLINIDREGRMLIAFEVETGPLFKFEFEGNHHFSSEKLEDILELQKYPLIDSVKIEEMSDAITNFYKKAGFFDPSVQGIIPPDCMETQKCSITFRIKEGERIFVKKIEFQGNKHFKSSYLRKEIERILNGSIEYKMLFVEPSSEVIDTLGLGGLPAEPVKPSKPKTISLARWKPKRIYLKDAYEEASAYLEDLYATEGFLETVVKQPEVIINSKTKEAVVTFIIEEGPRTWIESVSFHGVSREKEKDLQRIVKIKQGIPFNGIAVKEGENALLDYYLNLGYRFVSITSNVDFSSDGKKARIIYNINEGEPVKIESIEIQGNISTRSSLILDRITLKPNSLFTLKDQKKSSTYLRDLGIFNSVVISMLDSSTPGPKKKILIQVNEKKPQYLELRAGASSSEGIRGGFEYGYRNLFGYALDFRMMANLNYRFFFVGTSKYFSEWYREELNLLDQMERNVAVRLGVNHLPKVGKWLSLETSFGHQRKNANLFGFTKNSVYETFLAKPTAGFNIAIRAGFEDSNLQTNTVAEKALTSQIQNLSTCTQEITTNCLTPSESRALRLPVGKTAFWILGTDFSLDLRDNAFNPTSGVKISMGLTWVRSNGYAAQEHRIYASNDAYKAWTTYAFSNLLRNTISLSGYIPLGTKKVILMLSGAAGYIFQLQDGSETFADRLFYLGGSHTMRGFPEESLCTVESPAGVCLYGGNLMVNYRLEVAFQIFKELGGAVFSDMGNLWKDPSNFSFTEIRATLGFGIRYSTPIGPLNLDYGFILKRDESRGEPIGSLHFSIGTF